MPRANRHFQPGYIWHITHRCHQREFLLKFAKDRHRWRHWLFEACKRYDLCVLNYIVTSNHIHLLVRDRGKGEIARSMQLIAGRTAQEYNERKNRRGAYWEDRYHATAVDAAGYLSRCMTYIDMNMVRAGAVAHPAQWDVCGYREIQNPPERYQVVDIAALLELLGMPELSLFQSAQMHAIEEATASQLLERDDRWTRSLALGSHAFVTEFQVANGVRASFREIKQEADGYLLREHPAAYGGFSDLETVALSANNEAFWE